MIWQDVIVQRVLDDRELVRALATAFEVNPRDVLIHRNVDGFTDPAGRKIVCLASDQREGFRLLLSLFTFFDSARQDDPIERMRKFACVAQTDCLISDDSPNPYVVTHISSAGEVTKAKLDVSKLDDKDEYHIVKTTAN